MGKKEGCVICPYYSLCFLTDVCFVEVSHFSLLVFDLGICILAARILISYLEGKNIFVHDCFGFLITYSTTSKSNLVFLLKLTGY